MKFLYVLVSLIFISGCNFSSDNIASDSKIRVYTSFYPMYDFANKIAGDKAEVINLMPAGSDPHHWEPSPRDISGASESDIFIYSGMGMEMWVDKIISTISGDNILIVEASEGIEPILGHDHDHDEDHADDDHADDHSDEDGVVDPHVWLSFKNAKIQFENIYNAFVAKDPDNADYYKNNLDTYIKMLDEIDAEYLAELGVINDKKILVTHEAFGYLCNDYDIEQIGIDGVVTDSEPNPARMAEVVKYAKENNIKVIFYEAFTNQKVANTIANEISGVIEVLNPVVGLTEEEISGGEDYFSIMRRNLEAIKKSFTEGN